MPPHATVIGPRQIAVKFAARPIQNHVPDRFYLAHQSTFMSAIDSSLSTTSQSTPPRPSPSLFEAPLFWLSALLGLGVLSPLLPVPDFLTAVFATSTLTIAYVYFVVQFAVQATRRQWPVSRLLLLLVASLLLWAALQWITRPALQSTLMAYMQAKQEAPFGWRFLGIINMTVRSLALVCVGVFGGAIVARLIKTPNMMGPVCTIVALIDIWGVLFGGIVSKLLTNPATKPIAENAMAAMPSAGTASARGGYAIEAPSIGIGDFLFLGLLFAALHALNMNWHGAMRWVTPLVTIALLCITFGLIPFLPGLLFIGLGIAIPNWKYFEYTRDEKFALLWAGLFVVILTAVLYFVIVSQLPAK
ncbi:MAG: hypothetical protein JWN98_1257 [Abditibacteriota bacterium]|nr:hypothetical protein [Abditibacteriota bacterium]